MQGQGRGILVIYEKLTQYYGAAATTQFSDLKARGRVAEKQRGVQRERERDVILRGFRVRRRAGHNPTWPGGRSWMPLRLPGSLHLPPLLWTRQFGHLYPGK